MLRCQTSLLDASWAMRFTGFDGRTRPHSIRLISIPLGLVWVLVGFSCAAWFAYRRTGFLAMTLLLLLVISMHPEPADPCPCFDDTVAFIAVKIGFALAALVFPGSTGVGKEGDPFFTWTLIPKIVIGMYFLSRVDKQFIQQALQ